MNDQADVGPGLRYPGSPPFGESRLDSMLFFGRDADAEAALHSILSHDLFVLYARSGVGKTSLLKARVTRHLKQRDLWPVFVRMADTEQPPIELVRRALRDQHGQHGPDTIEVIGADDAGELYDLLANVHIWNGDVLQVPVLIFDQFEELFTLWEPTAPARMAFVQQLADVVRGARRADGSPRSTTEATVRPLVKVVLALREEFLGELDVFSRTIPKVLSHRQRLEALTPTQAEQAIRGPAMLNDAELDRTSPPFGYDDGAVEMILEALSGAATSRDPRSGISRWTRWLPSGGPMGGPTAQAGAPRSGVDTVEASQLQILCRHVETKIVAGRPNVVVTADDFPEGGPAEILKGFYSEELARFTSSGERRTVRRLCEDELILDGLRRSLDAAALGADEKLLDDLVDRRILRKETRAGRSYYELAHDSLVEPITTYRLEQTARTNQRTIAAVVIAAIVGFAVLAFVTGRGTSDDAAPVGEGPATVPIDIGDTATGSITMPGEIDRFRFDGDSGSAITFTMRPTGVLDAVLEVQESGRGSVGRSDAADARGVEVISLILSASGTYEVPVQGASGSTGDYELTLQEADPLVEGESLSGSVDAVDESDQFPFAGQAGEAVTITLQSQGDLDGILAVLDASGGEIARSNSGGAGGAEIVTAILRDDGTYVARVRGATDSPDGMGAYTLTLHRTEELSDGQSVDGSIDVAGTVDRFPLVGQAGAAVTVTLTPDDGLNGLLEMIDPAGARIEQVDSGGNGQTESITAILPIDGTYVVSVRGSPGSTGSFTVQMNESPITDIEIGDTAPGSIGEPGQVAVFRFAGLDDALTTVVVEPGGDLDPAVDVLDPGAVKLDRVDAFGKAIGEISTVRLREDGQYVVFVQGSNKSTGPFEITVVDGRNTFEDGAAAGAIDQNGEVDVFEADGAADDVVRLVMQPTGQDRLDAQLGLLDSDGREIAFVDNDFGGDAETILTVLPEGGTYVVVARGFTGSTGAYDLRLENLVTESIEVGTSTAGSIDERGDVEVFTFTTVTPGSRVQIDLESSARLEFDLLDPKPGYDMIVEDSASALLTLRREGEYNLVVRGRGSSKGDFTLTLSELSVETLQLGGPVDRSLEQPSEFDVFEFYGTAGTAVRVTLQPGPGLIPALDLLDASTGEAVGFPTTLPDGALIREGFLPDDGAYLVYVRAPDGSTGGYTLTLL